MRIRFKPYGMRHEKRYQMLSIEDKIATWLNERPDWMRVLVDHILILGLVDNETLKSLATDLIQKKVTVSSQPLTATSLPVSSSTGSKVELLEIRDLVNINALTTDSSLTFGEEGLTVIYGDNGSGKSGFARLAKDVVAARHKQEILPNAFNSDSDTEQSAVIRYRVDGQDKTLSWPTGVAAELTQIHFYDEACGDDYLVSDTELAYRPSALKILDELIHATDNLRAILDEEHSKLNTSKYQIEGLQPLTESSKFLNSLSANTTSDEIEATTLLDDDAEDRLATLIQEEARLQSTNQAKEKKRLEDVAKNLEMLAAHFDKISSVLGIEPVRSLEKKIAHAQTLRQAADAASKVSFTDEPLEGIGTESWRALWEAAEEYSQQEAYHEHEFPFIQKGAVCPLCQQSLSEDTATRLNRFKTFVNDQTAKKAKDAESEASKSISYVNELDISTATTTNALTALEVELPELATSLKKALTTAEDAKTRLGQRLRKETEEEALNLETVDTDNLRNQALEVRGRSEKIDAAAFAAQLKGASTRKYELADRIELAKHLDKIKDEVVRLQKVRDIGVLKNTIGTQATTVFSTGLARVHVNEVVNDRFARESEMLGLDRIKLADKGGDKGKLRHKPALLNSTLQTKTVQDVLSEGEQTALGIAGLMTEVYLDASESALILDDPITSLDHGRREKVARRLAELGRNRQVVVFTHDLTFLGDLVKAAQESGVKLTERSIIKHRDNTPGHVLETHPWKAKDAKQRIGALREKLAKIKKESSTIEPEECDERVQLWAGFLSETLERIVRNDIVGAVVDRGTAEVKPRMVKLLAAITKEDNDEYLSIYSEVSKWAARHDKSEGVNFIAPSFDDMEAILARLDSWYKTVKTYSQNTNSTA